MKFSYHGDATSFGSACKLQMPKGVVAMSLAPFNSFCLKQLLQFSKLHSHNPSSSNSHLKLSSHYVTF